MSALQYKAHEETVGVPECEQRKLWVSPRYSTGALPWKSGIGSFDHRLHWRRFSLGLVKSKAEGGALARKLVPTAVLARLP